MFNDGHDNQHIQSVIKESIYLSRKYGADENMSNTIAAYHDLGIPMGRSNHHLTSAAILENDSNLMQWFMVIMEREEILCLLNQSFNQRL